MAHVFSKEKLRHHRPTRLRRRWPEIFDELPNWLFAPDPAPLPIAPSQEEFHDLKVQAHGPGREDVYNRELTRIKELSKERKTSHDEMSKTIRRVFYALVSACLFCIVTVAGTPDTEVLTPQTAVELPALNYAMGLEAFLLVGPIVLIALAIYLHIFVGQHRRLAMAPENRHPMLPNFSDWTPQLAVYLIFYWMVPITLAVFAWKAWPRPVGPILGYVTLGVAAMMVLLQFRRCRPEWRGWALPLLVVAYGLFHQGFVETTASRKLNLSMTDLSGKDLRALNLSRADLSGANLSDTDLRGANLSGAMLHNANLSKAKLFKADLSGANLLKANLSDADLIGAFIEQYVLDQACGDENTRLAIELTIKKCLNDR